ncbi:Mutant cadherin [Operophtera brumata]|uniref:Mutant cadherin n=1 Tax=Operophtera brumata TaxID=104452 RepID=A0A0L7K4D4_OPEBR|nr:Mutant cadherin [Operophtera brumata]
MDIAQQERLNLRLVKEVEKHPCLYKTDSVEYSRRGITDKAWAEVGRVVGWPAFNMEEVEKSKNLLFDSITTDIRKIMRKKKSEGKTQRDLEDIITVLKSLDPESIPIFVAKDLHRLPPVLFDHLDCSALLKDITLLKAQMESIKNTYVTTEQLHNLEVKLHSNRYDSIVDTHIHHRYDQFR